MRGDDEQQLDVFSYVSPEQRIQGRSSSLLLEAFTWVTLTANMPEKPAPAEPRRP
jgi:hypothetical protein